MNTMSIYVDCPGKEEIITRALKIIENREICHFEKVAEQTEAQLVIVGSLDQIVRRVDVGQYYAIIPSDGGAVICDEAPNLKILNQAAIVRGLVLMMHELDRISKGD